jgi:hypothetical protein
MNKREAIVVMVFVGVAALAVMLSLLSTKLAIAFVLGIAVAAAAFVSPMTGLILYVMHLLFSPQTFFGPLRQIRSMLLLAGVVLLSFFVHKIFRRERIAAFSRKQDLLMFLLLAIVPASNIVNFRLGASLTGFMDFLTLYFLYFMIANIIDDYDKLRTLSRVLVACIVVIAANGDLQHFRGADLMGVTPVLGRIRWVAAMSDPNDFALAIVSFIPFLLVPILNSRTPKYQRAALLPALAIMVAAIYFSNSRGGFLALLAVLTLYSFKRWGVLRGVLVGVFFVLVGVVLSPSRMDQLSPYESSASGRIDAWVAGLSMLKHHPVLGVGFKNFLLFHIRAAHSAYVNCFAELGIVGYFVWLALIFTSFSGLAGPEKEHTPGYETYAGILQMSLTGFVVGAFFLSQTYGPILYILVGLSALVASNPEMAIRPRPFLAFKDIWKVAVIALGSIAFYQIMAFVYY